MSAGTSYFKFRSEVSVRCEEKKKKKSQLKKKRIAKPRRIGNGKMQQVIWINNLDRILMRIKSKRKEELQRKESKAAIITPVFCALSQKRRDLKSYEK